MTLPVTDLNLSAVVSTFTIGFFFINSVIPSYNIGGTIEGFHDPKFKKWPKAALASFIASISLRYCSSSSSWKSCSEEVSKMSDAKNKYPPNTLLAFGVVGGLVGIYLAYFLAPINHCLCILRSSWSNLRQCLGR